MSNLVWPVLGIWALFIFLMIKLDGPIIVKMYQNARRNRQIAKNQVKGLKND